MNAESQGARARQVDEAMSAVRGRAQESRGLVEVETDAYGTITDLRISDAAMSSDAARLAAVISQCHRKAREKAETEAARLLGQLAQDNRPVPTAAKHPQWEEVAPLRITYRM
ncbi:YbaB/EbfC family nucleoid-associated protein [Nocardia uniformis]|uniref:YbaB/EbfC family nucleoid-associated protein n=1 Tax=Nocardia uniformis TaxID=53432 RepID=A0A849CF38_9NOCA|nr:YbaB/EbfC family nucleoid-associated protein [Nocardia uniformis]NNH75285.1 YbaB/EbfC family nucleoid-associated protein [Nocardia uniformis]